MVTTIFLAELFFRLEVLPLFGGVGFVILGPCLLTFREIRLHLFRTCILVRAGTGTVIGIDTGPSTEFEHLMAA